MSRQDPTTARIAALRGGSLVPLPPGGDALPRARLQAGRFAQVGHLLLLGISQERYLREQRRGLLDLFQLGPACFALEVPPDHIGPPTDFLEAGA